jgi:hypothetical protein
VATIKDDENKNKNTELKPVGSATTTAQVNANTGSVTTNTANKNVNTKTSGLKGVDSSITDKFTGYSTPGEYMEAQIEADDALNGVNKANQSIGISSSTKAAMKQTFSVPTSVTEADAYLKNQLAAIQSGKTSYTDQVKDMMSQIQNREEFSYDVDNDPLFQQALASSMNSGKIAMQDTIGQAAALTGGYGSTYATTAGNQAYNAFIQDAYDNLPQYYQMAMEAYQMEGDELYRQLGMLTDADNTEYARMQNAYDTTSAYRDRRYDEAYTKYRDDKNDAFQMANLELSEDSLRLDGALGYYDAASTNSQIKYDRWSNEVDQALQYGQMLNNDYWQQTTFDEDVRQYEQDFAEEQRQFDQSYAQEDEHFYKGLEHDSSENQKDRDFSASESQKDRDWQDADREDTQSWNSSESQKDRDFTADESQKDRDFTSSENQKDRDFTSSENQKDRDWKDADREDTQAWNDASREDEQAWQDANREDTQAWNDASREDEQAWNDANREDQQAWNSYENSLNRNAKSSSSGGGGDGSVADSIPKDISSKASKFTNNGELNDYLANQVNSGNITEEQADYLYSVYETPTQDNSFNALQNRTWTLVDDGGKNGGGGIDKDAVVKDQYGNEYTMEELYGTARKTTSDEKARDWVLGLQESTGATKKKK